MEANAKPIGLIGSPWSESFESLLASAQEELLLVSPFLGCDPIDRVTHVINQREAAGQSRVHVSLLTNLKLDSLICGSVDMGALVRMSQRLESCDITHLPGLHAKVYVADGKSAVVTSANLTRGGLMANQEYGVLINDAALVSQVRRDIQRYASLGALVSPDELSTLLEATRDLRLMRRQADNSMNRKLRHIFDRRLRQAGIELLKMRARGKTTQSILSEAIIYLLSKHGSLTTSQLNPLVQQIHPDLCDDSIDRVIEGVHFGKRWKHHIRSAQQALKRQRFVEFDGHKWFLRSEAGRQ